MEWKDVDDSHLEEYKNYQLDLTKSKSNACMRETINCTTNRKLRIIYEFYWWAQNVQLLIAGRISYDVDAPIRSNIAEYKKDPGKFKKDKAALRTIYPLCETVTAEIGRHRRQHYATPEEVASLREHFRGTCDTLTAERNVLILDIINDTGWREATVASLTVGQFSEEKINESLSHYKKTLEVIPDHQKLGYSNAYDTTVQLVIRIQRYIREVRQKMFDRLNNTETTIVPDAEAPLFVSYTSGEALPAKTISKIISAGFRSIGVVGQRAGPHSIRRKFGKEKSREIQQVRQRMGISTDPQDIMLDLAVFLGHSNIASQNAYNAGKRDIYTESIESGLRGRIAELEASAASMRLEACRREDYILQLERQSRGE